MFDLFGIIDFKKNVSIKRVSCSFEKLPFYETIPKKQYHTTDKEKYYFSWLERQNFGKNFYEDAEIIVLCYGTVFTNKQYEIDYKIKPKIIYAAEIKNLYAEKKIYLHDYIKGSFVLLIYNKYQNTFKVITDRHNILPLYYSYQNNMLIISSSVRLILQSGLISKNYDKQALTEQLIFDYLLEDKTYFKDIKQTLPASVYTFDEKRVNRYEYWSIENLYQEKILEFNESLELMADQLYENVNLYASDSEHVLSSLTGGLDGRTNLALLEKNPEEFLCYSYGMPESPQITIPQEICNNLGFQYEPILLNSDYENTYQSNAMKVIEFSNGTAPIIRANYPYAFSKLSKFSDIAVTGLLGSEILRPLHRGLGIFTNYYVEEMLLRGDLHQVFDWIMDNIEKKEYIKSEYLYDIEPIYQYIKGYKDKYKKYGKLYPYFFYYLNEGVRKYFMQEIQVERPYVTTRMPYFDDDMLDVVFQTPFAGMYNGFLKDSKVKRRKAQLLYGYIINKYKPILGKFYLDRGYKPSDLIKPFPVNYLNLFIGVQKKRLLKKYKKETFSHEWPAPTINKILSYISLNNSVFDQGIFKEFENNNYKNDYLRYNHMISLIKYFDSL